MKDFIELTIEQQFELAVEKSNKARQSEKVKLDNNKLLELYSLFKQATVGDNQTDQPWAIELTKRAKWDAWKGREGLTRNTASRLYIKLVERLEL